MGQASATAQQEARALSPRLVWWRRIWFLAIALTGCAVDLSTKYWVFQWRGMPRHSNRWWIIEGYVGIEPSLNPGALFGFGAGAGPFFAGVSIVAAIVILFLIFVRGWVADRLLTLSLALILGGILGNLYDRLGLWQVPGAPGQWRSEVRDWILLCYGPYTWPNFNIADSMLVAGAIGLFWHAWRGSPGAVHESKDDRQ